MSAPLQDEPGFRNFFIGLLADAPYAAFRWETPRISADLVHRPFEFALLDSPELAVEPDPGKGVPSANTVPRTDTALRAL